MLFEVCNKNQRKQFANHFTEQKVQHFIAYSLEHKTLPLDENRDMIEKKTDSEPNLLNMADRVEISQISVWLYLPQ
jgi:hypothetical protein